MKQKIIEFAERMQFTLRTDSEDYIVYDSADGREIACHIDGRFGTYKMIAPMEWTLEQYKRYCNTVYELFEYSCKKNYHFTISYSTAQIGAEFTIFLNEVD